MIIKKLFGYIPIYKLDKSKHRQYTSLYEDLCM